MSSDAEDVMPSELDTIFKKASREILCKQDGFYFSTDNIETNDDNDYQLSYKNNELAEFINFDILQEEGKNTKPFSNLTINNKYENITKDKGVRKLVLDHGK